VLPAQLLHALESTVSIMHLNHRRLRRVNRHEAQQ
jgi:hypothetical protein